MTKRRNGRIAFTGIVPLLIFLSLAAGCGEEGESIYFDPGNGESETIEFQDGVLPSPSYTGTRDAFLKDGPGLDNHNFGQVASDTVGIRLLTASYYESRFIIRFDISGLTGCAEINSVVLFLRLSLPSADSLVFEAHEATVPQVLPGTWLEGVGGLQGGVSWVDVDGEISWDTKGGDLVGAPFDSATVEQDTVMTIEIPSDLAFRWIEDPLSNHGIVLRLLGTFTGEHVILHTRESVAAFRPRLMIEYIPGG